MIEMLVVWIVLAAAVVAACAMLREIFDWWGRWRKSKIAVLKRVVGPDTPPTDEALTWARGLSPWHADAFPLAFREYAPERGERKAGWFKLDYYGNVEGWVPDGAVVFSPAPEGTGGGVWTERTDQTDRMGRRPGRVVNGRNG